MRHATVILAIGLCMAVSLPVQAVLTNGGMITLTAPTNLNAYGGGGIAFIPANTDSISQDTLVINWKQNDNTHVFQRITIPTGGGASQVLATATLSSSFAYGGTTIGSANMQDLAFDAANGKLVTATGNSRFLSFDLFDTNTTITSIGYSKAEGTTSTNFGRVITVTPDGRYQTFYPSSGLLKISIAPTDMNGTVSHTKQTIPTASFTGWYPKADGTPTAVNGYDCEGAVTYDSSNVLMLRNFNNGTAAETHLYMAGSALDAAAINAYTDMGNATSLNAAANTYYGWGLTANPAAGVAFVRYGYLNSAGSYSRILMVGGLPAVPDPTTLALMLGGGALMTVRRRRA